ncbi:MAG: hypothetical protein KDK78_05080, partial [Chlamydiia bacterium]|nr:hypothetical protein [Chlamydiia bacterium]
QASLNSEVSMNWMESAAPAFETDILWESARNGTQALLDSMDRGLGVYCASDHMGKTYRVFRPRRNMQNGLFYRTLLGAGALGMAYGGCAIGKVALEDARASIRSYGPEESPPSPSIRILQAASALFKGVLAAGALLGSGTLFQRHGEGA